MIRLANTEERNAQSNGRFELPDLRDRQTLQPGDYAKVIFEAVAPWGPGERMWVKVEILFDNGRYLGTLSNTPIAVTELNAGDKVEFGSENICEIMRRAS
jgi:uncharacterized protein YegJ (DUF2314 family)